MERPSIRSSEVAWVNGDRIHGTLSRDFYERDTLQVARDLLGKILIVRSRPSLPLDHPQAAVTAARIVETEAYHGSDPAAHCSRGETPRTQVMFGDPGVAYVYFIYGNYEMLNFVTEKKGYPGAVLIRAVEPVMNEALMQRRRRGHPRRLLTSGPGRLCRAMGIRMIHNGHSLQGPALFVADDGRKPDQVLVSPRVGISAGKDKWWRFYDAGSEFVSKVPQNKMARGFV